MINQPRHDESICNDALFHPSWILIAWGVVAVAAASKFWRLTRGYRDRMHLDHSAASTEASRRRLETIWEESP
ncbi:MAG: hypothetical protein CMN91_09725 [Synechococcus sp. ARS1019]|nr:hypothetical protein [Synechococcus sp. ARS1019]